MLCHSGGKQSLNDLPKQTHLPRVLITARLLPRLRGDARRQGDFLDAFRRLVTGFELVEDFLGARDDVFGEAGDPRDLDAEIFTNSDGACDGERHAWMMVMSSASSSKWASRQNKSRS